MSKRRYTQNHGCLFYIFLGPFLLPFYFMKWMFGLIGNLFIYLIAFSITVAIFVAIGLVSLSIAIPVLALFILFVLAKAIVKAIIRRKHIPNYDNMSGIEFEKFCQDLLLKNGYTHVETTPASGDQGIDILAQRNGIKYGIQCKCYASNIGNSAVQEVFAGAQYYGCDQSVVLTNRFFTKSAVDLSNRTGVLLWDRNELQKLINFAFRHISKPAEEIDVSQSIDEVKQKISGAIEDIGNIYINVFKQFRYSDVVLIESRNTDQYYEFVYEAESPEQLDYILTIEDDLNDNLSGQHYLQKLYGNRFLLKVYHSNC